jgi:hypothetical protein
VGLNKLERLLMPNSLGYLSVSPELNRVEHITVRVTLPSNIRLNLAGTNTLAYFASKTGKMFVTLTPAGFIFYFSAKIS